jgi:hypothetical protein
METGRQEMGWRWKVVAVAGAEVIEANASSKC